MRYRLLIWLGFCSSVAFCASAVARELTPGEGAFQKALGRVCPVVALWPADAIPDEAKPLGAEQVGLDRNRPGTLMVRNVSQPSIMIASPPEKVNTGAAIVLCPGGSYGGLALDRIVESARRANARGITAILLKYRVPKRNQGLLMYHHALQDAQRAVGILRSRAAEWKLDPDKIGVGGFSAGGHLAATIANLHEPRLYSAVDASDKVSCRPDFSVLVDPAYLTNPILSRKLTPHLQTGALSPKNTPPTFVAGTTSDKFTLGAVDYALALREVKVRHELHIYPSADGMDGAAATVGSDGGDIEQRPLGLWAAELQRWLGDLGIVPSARKPEPLTYLAANLPDVEPAENLTLGDTRLRQILGHDAPVIPVWPTGKAPDQTHPAGPETVTHRSRGGTALNITNVTQPTLTLIKPSEGSRTRRAVIVCPGGGYGALAAEHEGTRVAQWLNELGITALLLKYRVPRPGGEFAKHHHALQDLQRAMRIVRSRANEWEIDSKQIGVCGFSAGGHLCTTLATNFQNEAYPPIDEIDSLPSRPDFALLVYPAYLTDPIASDQVDKVARGALQRGTTPPLFMTVAANDRFARGMLNFYVDVRQAEVDAECHVYESGGHGGGLDPVSYPTSQWTRAATRWLDDLANDVASD
jgi:acetyl esterase/lipase